MLAILRGLLRIQAVETAGERLRRCRWLRHWQLHRLHHLLHHYVVVHHRVVVLLFLLRLFHLRLFIFLVLAQLPVHHCQCSGVPVLLQQGPHCHQGSARHVEVVVADVVQVLPRQNGSCLRDLYRAHEKALSYKALRICHRAQAPRLPGLPRWTLRCR